MARSALLALAIGVVSLTAVAVATSSPSPPALKNGGTLTISRLEPNAGTVRAAASSTINLNGNLPQAAGGTTLLEGGTIAPTATVILQGGTLSGFGTIKSDLNNGAVVRPGGPGAPR